MKPHELFKMIHTREGYRHIGRDLSYKFHVDHEHHCIYILFQGSNGLRDWWHNFLAAPTNRGALEPYRNCGWRVHLGFRRVWRSGNDQVMRETLALWERFRESRPVANGPMSPYHVCFAGFSHGAALAQLAAEDWSFRGQGDGARPDCVCFGSPKLAWGEEAVRRLGGSMILISWINRADLITKVPLARWGFRHVREHFVSVRRVPLLSLFRVGKHHQIYDREEIYPQRNAG